MPVSQRLKKTAARSLSVLLASSLTLTVLSTFSVSAQIGPQPPERQRPPDNAVTKTITKFFKSKKAKEDAKLQAENGKAADPQGELNSTNETTRTSPAADSEKLRVSDPARDLKQQTDALSGKPGQLPGTSAVKHPPLLNQLPLTNAKVDPPQIDSQNPPNLSHPKLDDPNNPLGFADTENKLKKYSLMISAQRYAEARPGLFQLRQRLVDLTEAHIGLYKTLNQIPSARGQAELEKELALEFAQLRDRSMLETAKIYIEEKDYPKAIKELTDVVKSQPRSQVGLRAYGLLQEIGFTEKLQLAQ